MNNPTHDQLALVVSNFDSVIPPAGDAIVSMGSVDVAKSKRNICGTPMCHGGWYAVSSGHYNKWYKRNLITYSDGALLIAQDLGFSISWELAKWARDNPEVWGNDLGIAMFVCASAFITPDQLPTDLTLTVIRNHWAKVNNRLYPDYRIELL